MNSIFELIVNFETLIQILELKGKNDIANKKRIETYKKSVLTLKEIKNIYGNDLEKSKNILSQKLTKAPLEKLAQYVQNGYFICDKEPYGNIIIKNGKIIEQTLPTINLQILNKQPTNQPVNQSNQPNQPNQPNQLNQPNQPNQSNQPNQPITQLVTQPITQQGNEQSDWEKLNLNDKINLYNEFESIVNAKVGIGKIKIKDILNLGYKDINSLQQNYKNDKRIKQGILNSLDKYFAGQCHDQNHEYNRNKLKLLVDSINNIIKESSINTNLEDCIKYTVCGSYSRNKEDIGDLDFVICLSDIKTSVDYSKFINIFINVIKEKLKVYNFESVSSKILRVWVDINGITEKVIGKEEKIKIEFYFYKMPLEDYIFAVYARTIHVDEQKKIRMDAKRKGYLLSDKGIYKNEIKLSKEQLGSYPTTLEEINDIIKKLR